MRTRSALRLFPVVLVLGLLAGCFGGGSGHGDHPSSKPTLAKADVKPLTDARVAQLSSQLSSGNEKQVRTVLAVPTGQKLDPGAATAIAALGTIAFDSKSYEQTDATHAQVDGTVEHPTAGAGASWTFRLIWLDNTWMVVDAEPVK